MRPSALQAAVVLFCGLGCGRVAGVDEYETEDATWGCLDRPAPPPAGPGPFNVTIHVEIWGDPRGVAGADVTLCPTIDPDCTTPVGAGITDPDGNVTLAVHRGFSGYVRMLRRDEMLPEGERLLSSFYYLNPAINGDQLIVVGVPTVQMANALTLLVDVPQAPSRGTLLLSAFDCKNARAAGIIFESNASDEETTPFFSRDAVPDIDAPHTDQSGFGGFLNAIVGFTHFSARSFEIDRTIDTVGLTVRAGVLTQTRMVPSRWPPASP
jgi:hypothetical protein